MTAPTRKLVPFAEAAPQIEDGSLLLFQGRSSVSCAIKMTGRSPYSHAAKAVWWRDRHGKPIRLFCFEMIETESGGRVVPLDWLIRTYDGLIDVYRTNADDGDDYDRDGAVRWTVENVPCTPYSKKGLFRMAREYAIGIRWIAQWLWPADTDEDAVPNGSMFCSEACDAADHFGGGHKPVKGLACYEVQPGDLSHSDFYSYFCTIDR